MRNSYVIWGLVFAIACSTAANADWQYTRWGMSPHEVTAASHGTATSMIFDPNSVDPMLRNHLAEIEASAPSLHAPYSANGMDFDAQFHFANGKLDRVELAASSALGCPKLQGDLNGQYGVPDEHYARTSTSWWRDTQHGNHIMFTITPNGNCIISYEALTTQGSSGL